MAPALLLHIILMAYWLGSDVGVFVSGRMMVSPKLPISARAAVMKVFSTLDVLPRIALILMLPSGFTLIAAGMSGSGGSMGWPLIAAWSAAAAWLVIMLVAYFRSPAKHARLAERVDLVVRVVVIAGLVLVAGVSLSGGALTAIPSTPLWLSFKLLAYSLAILCGLLLRVAMRPFGPAWGQLMTTGSTPEVESALGGSIRRGLPFVFGIWFFVLTAAAFGVFKPGAFS